MAFTPADLFALKSELQNDSKALGLTIPQSVLAQTTQVIQ